MADALLCAQFQHLKREYERSLRVWAHYAFPLHNEALEFPKQCAELKYEAQLSRDLAARLLSAHKESCPLCTTALDQEQSLGF
jgi:hypothetical protein